MGLFDSKEKITVKVFRGGSTGTEVSVRKGASVKAALRKGGLNKKDSEIVQVNGDVESMSFKLSDGDQVVLVKNIEGGNTRI